MIRVKNCLPFSNLFGDILTHNRMFFINKHRVISFKSTHRKLAWLATMGLQHFVVRRALCPVVYIWKC